MATNGSEPTLVIVQLSGGNDFMNTVIPYGNSLYYDFRPVVSIPEDKVLPIDGDLGFNPNFAPVQNLYDRGDVAIIQGVGYPRLQQITLPQHGHLAHVRAEHGCDRRLARQGGEGTGPPIRATRSPRSVLEGDCPEPLWPRK